MKGILVMECVIDTLQSYVDKIKNHDKVQPGMPALFTEACQSGDGIWQGDLGLELVDKVPSGYKKVIELQEKDKQLVLGNTQGARHCLNTLDGVVIYHSENWNDESLNGPCLVLSKDNIVFHPIHGSVSLLKDTIILCRYQKEWDKEQQKERRQQD